MAVQRENIKGITAGILSLNVRRLHWLALFPLLHIVVFGSGYTMELNSNTPNKRRRCGIDAITLKTCYDHHPVDRTVPEPKGFMKKRNSLTV